MDILIDSSVIIAWERDELDLDAVLERHANDYCAMAAVTVAELRYGVLKRPVRYRVDAETFVQRLLTLLPVIPFDQAAAEVHASIRLSLEKAGATLGHHDLQIAATAIANQMVVAARDRDFGRVDQLTVLRW